MTDVLGLLVLITATCIAGALARRLEERVTAPLTMFVGWVVVFVVGDAIYTILDGTFGPSPVNRSATPYGQLGVAAALWGLAVMAVGFGYITLPRIRWSQRKNADGQQGTGPSRGFRAFLLLSIVLGLVISGVAIGAVVLAGRQMGLTLARTIAVRNQWFAGGGGILFLLTQTLKIAVLVYIFYCFGTPALSRARLILLVVLVSVIDLMTGSRSALLYGLVVPLLVIRDHLGRQLRLRTLVWAALAAVLLLSVAYRSIVRDQFFASNEGRSVLEIIQDNLRSLPSYFWGGYEVSAFDGTIDIAVRVPKELEYQYGKTLVNGLTAPIPRALWPGKPLGGGNMVYTATFYPSYYQHLNTEYSLSIIGELYMNFGVAGVLAGSVLIGMFLRWLYGKANQGRGRNLWLLVYGVVMGRMLGLWRSDFFNFFGQTVGYLVLILALASGLRAVIGVLQERRRPYVARQGVSPA